MNQKIHPGKTETAAVFRNAAAATPSQNPWYLITHDEILGIYENLYRAEQDLTGTRGQYLQGIMSILHDVRDRRS